MNTIFNTTTTLYEPYTAEVFGILEARYEVMGTIFKLEHPVALLTLLLLQTTNTLLSRALFCSPYYARQRDFISSNAYDCIRLNANSTL